MTPTLTDVRGVLGALEACWDSGPAALAFDGDGTLWTGDVGEDVFEHALASAALGDEPVAELRAQAVSHGLDPDGDATELCRRLFDAYRSGAYPEHLVCEVMAWCYAGLTEEAVRELAREALSARRIAERRVAELEPVIDWARERGVRTVVISASPLPVVLEASAQWGFAAGDVAAARAALEGGVLAPRMASPLPYGSGKVSAGRALLGGARWLGAFGDNAFDLDMLLAADVGVAVRPKPALLARLADHPTVRVLAA